MLTLIRNASKPYQLRSVSSFRQLFRLPQPMQIAVFVCRNYGITLGEREDSDGFITRLQRFALTAILGLKEDPLDEVRLQHGMLHRADRDGDGPPVYLHDGHVLLPRRVRGIGRKRLHRLAAAVAADAGILDVGDDIAAVFTTVVRTGRIVR